MICEDKSAFEPAPGGLLLTELDGLMSITLLRSGKNQP